MFLTELAIFIISIFILSKASHTVIKSSIKIARITRLGELTVGFLFLSIATVIPETTISITSVISGNFGIAIGNILGSNITVLLLVAGLMGFIKSVNMTENTLVKLTHMLFLCSLILIVLMLLNYLSKIIGLALLFLFILFNIYSVKSKITLGNIRMEEPFKLIPKLKISVSLLKTILYFFIGMTIILISAWFAVNSAANIATSLKIDQSFIGATILSVCASLPELTVAVGAQKEGHIKLGLGDIIGSSLTRLTFVLGLVLLVSPFSINIDLFTVLVLFVFMSTILLWFFLGSFGRRKLDRMEGFILIVAYFVFLFVMSIYLIPI